MRKKYSIFKQGCKTQNQCFFRRTKVLVFNLICKILLIFIGQIAKYYLTVFIMSIYGG